MVERLKDNKVRENKGSEKKWLAFTRKGKQQNDKMTQLLSNGESKLHGVLRDIYYFLPCSFHTSNRKWHTNTTNHRECHSIRFLLFFVPLAT